MKMLHKSISAMAVMLLTVNALCSNFVPQPFVDMLLSEKPLTAADWQAIRQRKISPHQAAQILRSANDFTLQSVSFSPYLHRLYYRLGQLTHSPEAPWQAETMQICTALARYTALFNTVRALDVPQNSPMLLYAWKTPDMLPESDCTSFSAADLTTQACWQAQPGQQFQAAVIALPLRALKNVQISATALRSATTTLPVQPQLQAVEYFPDANGQWQHRFAAVGSTDGLYKGMQIYSLQIALPDDLPAGEYCGKVILQIPGSALSTAMQYKLIISNTMGDK